MKGRKTWSIFFFLLLLIQAYSQTDEGTIYEEIDKLISKMTIEEKVGQMTQITIQVVAKNRGWVDQQFEVDPVKLEEAITKYHVGSILNVYDAALSLKEWNELIKKIQDIAIRKTRLKIPVLYGIDAIHGANYIKEATLFPHAIAMAAARDPELVRKSAEITAKEIRAAGIPWNFNPVLDVGRHQAWPRLFETFGEDPYLASVMGVEYVRGMQGKGDGLIPPEKAAACLKHYVGYSFPFSGKDRTPAYIPDNMMREIFLLPFKKAVEAGALTVMVNSAEVNGIPGHANSYLLTDVLKKEFGFKGLVVSDWRDILNLYDRDHVAGSPREAVKMAVMAGIDMSMVPYDYSFYNDLLALVRDGEVPISRIDDAVRRILYVKFRLGLFENPYPVKKLIPEVQSKEAVRLSYEAAARAITLLENKNGVLPLQAESRILVSGPTANLRKVLNGGWSYTWQGNEEELYPTHFRTIKEALMDKLGTEKVLYYSEDELMKQHPADLADKADAVVLCLGEMPYCETPGNINDLALPKEQYDLVKYARKINKPVILVLVEGRPRLITPVVDLADGILLAYLPGPMGSKAIADVLFGDINPSGKLPYTYPGAANDLINYDYKWLSSNSSDDNRDKQNPLYPFGYGLSYTTFQYANLALSADEIGENDSLVVKVTVKNTGKREGREVVELYVSDLFRTVSPPVKQLKRFASVVLKPGEEKEISFSLTLKDLAFMNRENQWGAEPGEFLVQIGPLQKKFQLRSDKNFIKVNY